MKEASFKLPDGRELNWYETGQGRPLVLLHGWAMSAMAFSELAPLLAQNFRVLVPDLPGHGKSTPAEDNSLGGLAFDLTCWLQSVEQAPVVLGGWSLGGMLALEMARLNKLSITKMVLIGTTPHFTATGDWPFGLPVLQVRALARNLERRFETTLADFFSLAFAGEEISKERLRVIRNFAVKQSFPPDPHVALALLNELAVQDQRDYVLQVKLPTLVLHGSLDQITPVSAARSLANMLPKGHFFELSGVGHCPFMSRPEDVALKIVEFC